MFFGNPSPFARSAPPFSALTCTKESGVQPAPPVNAYFVAFFRGDAAVLSDVQLSTIDYQPQCLSPQPTQNEHLQKIPLQLFCNEHLRNA
jgi:hypothetical protein